MWTLGELLATLGDDGPTFARAYGASADGNYREEAGGHATGANILHLPRDLDDLTRELGEVPAALAERLTRARTRLLELRSRRVRPLLDDKVLTDWNGLAISTFAYAGRVLDEARYVAAAREAADFLLGTLRRDGGLYHRYREGNVAISGLLDDHAFLALGLLELYEARDRLGVTVPLELIEAERALTQAWLDRIDATSSFNRAQHRLWFAVGGEDAP